MNDFLGRLIERERGAAGAVAPRLPSLYEPRRDALPAEMSEGETEEIGETVHAQSSRGAPQRHDEPKFAEPATGRGAVQSADTVSVEPIVEHTARRAPRAASDTISRDQLQFVAPLPQERATLDTHSRKPERATLQVSIAVPPSRVSPDSDTKLANTPEQSPEQVRAPSIEPRPAPPAAEPHVPVAALVPEPKPRRIVVQSPARPEGDAAKPMRPVAGPLPVTPVIATTRQAVEGATAATKSTIGAPPSPGIAPAPVRHADDAELPRDRDTPAPMPTIHVTIGRVEVRAVQAPAVRDTRPARASEQPMSLDEYLRRRSQRGQA